MTATDRGVDRLLDRWVVPGYTRFGLKWRSRTWSDDDPRPDALVGKRALVTGAGGGIGEAIALDLARLGATVHLVVRKAERATDAVERIEAALAEEGLPCRLVVEECDVSGLAGVRAFAAGFNRRGEALDVIVHNAGVLPKERTESVDGYELTVATHVLGPVLMTELLRPALRLAEDGARVTFVASGGMYAQSLPADDINCREGTYRGASAYARSKRMQVELAPILDLRWAEDSIRCYAMHPGWVNTPGITDSLPGFSAVMKKSLRTAAEGADTAVWLSATEPVPRGGGFWHDRCERPRSYFRATQPSPLDVGRVWDWVAETLELG